MISTTAASDRPSVSPWLMLVPPPYGDDNYRIYDLDLSNVVSLNKPPKTPTDSGLKLVGSSHGWLASYHPKTSTSSSTTPSPATV